MENTSAIVSKVWSFCNPLRDIGVGYGDYLEQLTYLLFLKMADEFSKPPYNRKLPIPTEHNWESLTSRRGDELEQHYSKTLNVFQDRKVFWGKFLFKVKTRLMSLPCFTKSLI
ncbi:MAG TPA: type I restriction-modification system subunit M N-terminal domain-containing protein [Niabella sp.]|nr:type I restriction-modification system subunit M N-terminal domain-containing protein [Niabella sp.]